MFMLPKDRKVYNNKAIVSAATSDCTCNVLSSLVVGDGGRRRARTYISPSFPKYKIETNFPEQDRNKF